MEDWYESDDYVSDHSDDSSDEDALFKFDDSESTWIRSLRSSDLPRLRQEMETLPKASQLHWVARSVVWLDSEGFVQPLDWASFCRGLLAVAYPLVKTADPSSLQCLMSILSHIRSWITMTEDHIELTLERRRTGDTVEEAKKLWKECSEAALERWLELGDDVLYPLVLTTGAAHKLPSLVSPWALLFEGDKEELSKDMEPFGTIDGEKGSEDREHQSANPRRPSLTELTKTEQLASASPENSPSLP